MPTTTNRLIHETSPYLLQHAHNPVDWYPWSEEAFERARQENKPVLVSIGYAACHWCHVMERESFEDDQTAEMMNHLFINIKVDREERPDVDHIYMDAVQAMTGAGGWPLNVFLTPDRKPFYGGTYFPPRRAFNRASWMEVLEAVAKAYAENPEGVQQQANNLTAHLQNTGTFESHASTASHTIFKSERIEEAFEAIDKMGDKEWGGFGRAPKFPQSFIITFVLRHSYLTSNEQALSQALLSLDKMIQGGIYDQVGGGFARYATDTEWLIPHFEKMLYDNALLVSTLAEAYQLRGKRSYKRAIEETLQFVERELMHPDGGFYSALDADSEGEEGKFYVWTYTEVQDIIGADAGIFCRYFEITPGGNWEGHNILRVKSPLATFAADNDIDTHQLEQIIAAGKEKLLEARGQRVRPLLDDKILLSWNALMNKAYSAAYAATGNDHYKEVAIRNMQFLLTAFRKDETTFYHTWKGGKGKHPAFLDDYSHVAAALVALAQATADYTYLNEVKAIITEVRASFSATNSPLFFYTHKDQQDILLRKKEVYDGATPSGNAVMAEVLYTMGILFDQKEWSKKAEEMIAALGEAIVKYPTSFGAWLTLLQQVVAGTNEIAIVGADWKNKLIETIQQYFPHSLIMASPEANDDFPILAEKNAPFGSTWLFLCKNYACQQPVSGVKELASLFKVKYFE